MQPLHLLAYFFGGGFAINALPHLAAGTMGRRFPSPFASPPGEGLSPAVVNVLWGFANLLLAWLLVCRIGSFDIRQGGDVAPFALGVLALGLFAARHFGAQNGGTGPSAA